MLHLCRVLIVLLCCASLAAHPQDYAREKRWADEILSGLVIGEPVWLELPNRRKFLNLYAAAKDAKIAILLVHGIGVHPDHGVIGILRGTLNDMGYTTLSVQMPVARAEGTADDYYPSLFPQAGERIAAAFRFLRSKGDHPIVLVSHSMGAWMANAHLAEASAHAFAAWIVLGFPGEFRAAIDRRTPILDVYAEHDNKPTLAGVQSRARAVARSQRSEQIMIGGSDHLYTGKEQQLAEAIHRFIARNVR